MVAVARLIFARNNQFNVEDRNKEMWNRAINNKLTCELNVGKRILKANYLKAIWYLF